MNVYTVCCGGTSNKRTKDVKGTQWIKNEKKEKHEYKIPAERMNVCSECVLSSAGLCEGPITRPEKNYRL